MATCMRVSNENAVSGHTNSDVAILSLVHINITVTEEMLYKLLYT